MSRNGSEGRYAGWCYGVHRRTRESLYDQPRWYWASRKAKQHIRLWEKYDAQHRKSAGQV